MKRLPIFLLLLCASLVLAACVIQPVTPTAASMDESVMAAASSVYVMTNDVDANAVVAFARSEDGSLSKLGTYPTGGKGAILDDGEGLDPLISAYSLYKTSDNKFLLAANAGSAEITAFMINEDFSLTMTSKVGLGNEAYHPLSIASNGNLIYVASFDGAGAGAVTGLTISAAGELALNEAVAEQMIDGRPSAVQVSADSSVLVVGVLNTGMIKSYTIGDGGALAFVNEATSTAINNAEGRNLPTPIGFEIRQHEDNTFVVVTEAREIQPNGDAPAGDRLQSGSVSVFAIDDAGAISYRSSAVAGTGFTPAEGERTTCWIAFAADGAHFWAANALEASISSFSFDGETGAVELINATAVQADLNPGELLPPDAFAQTEGFIDMFTSADGQYLYQLYGLTGKIGIYQIDGSSLTLVGEVTDEDLPMLNMQGIVAR